MGETNASKPCLTLTLAARPAGEAVLSVKPEIKTILLTISEIPVTMPEWSNATPQRPPAGTAAGAGPLRTGRNETAANALKTNDPAKWLISRPNDFNGLQTPSRNRSLRLRNEGFRFCRFWPRPGSMRNDRPRLRPAALPLHMASPGPAPPHGYAAQGRIAPAPIPSHEASAEWGRGPRAAWWGGGLGADRGLGVT